MCFLYPQVYDDGCEVKRGQEITCTPCFGHAYTFRRTKQPCGSGKVIISSCGPCLHHQKEAGDIGNAKTVAGTDGDIPASGDQLGSVQQQGGISPDACGPKTPGIVDSFTLWANRSIIGSRRAAHQ